MSSLPRSSAARGHVDRAFESAKWGANRADVVRGQDCNYRRGLWYGRGYDIYARLVAAHLGNHLPGKPNVVVQNVPGAASVKAAMLVYTRLRRTGPRSACFYPHTTGTDPRRGAKAHREVIALTRGARQTSVNGGRNQSRCRSGCQVPSRRLPGPRPAVPAQPPLRRPASWPAARRCVLMPATCEAQTW